MSAIVAQREAAAAEAKPAARRGLAPGRLALVICGVAACAGAVWYGQAWWKAGRFVETTDDAYVGGNITAISPHIAGFVSAILVGDNERVQAGQLLVRLDRRDMQAALDHAQAVVAARAAALANLQAQYVLQQSVIRQSAADRAAKTARAAFSRIDQARYATLAQSNSGSRQDAQRAQAIGAEADAAAIASAAGLEAALQQIKVLDTQIEEAGAMQAQARADLAAAALDLGYTDIRAPIDGSIGNRAAQVGAFVTQGTYLLSVIPSAGLWVDANFKEDQLSRMSPGQKATVTADATPGTVFQGHVASLAPGTGAVFSVIPPENATGNFTKIVQRVPVRILLDAGNPALAQLRPGLSTTARVDTRGVP